MPTSSNYYRTAARLSETRPVVGVAAIVRREGRFLLVERGRPPSQGHWAFPGGKQELGETIVEAAVRELEEETGVSAANPRLETVLDIIDGESPPRFHYTLVVMRLDWCAGEGVVGGDAARVGWFGLDEIEAMPVLATTAALMRSLAAAGAAA